MMSDKGVVMVENSGKKCRLVDQRTALIKDLNNLELDTFEHCENWKRMQGR